MITKGRRGNHGDGEQRRVRQGNRGSGDFGRAPGCQGAQERGRRSDLDALRRPHHRHLRRLSRRRHQDHRRAPRAGGGACRRRLLASERQDRLRGDHGRAEHDQRDDRHRQRVSRREPAFDDRRAGRAVAAQNGLAAGSAPRRHHVADLEIPRDVLDARVPLERARIPQPGAYRASTKSVGDPKDIEKLADLLVNAQRPAALFGTQVWTCRGHQAAVEFCRALNIPGYMNGSGRGIFAPGDAHGFNRTRSYAFDKADVILIVGCPFDFRLGYGRRLRADATVVQIDLDYRNVGKNRDISLGLVGDCGAILKAVEQAASGRASKGNAPRAEWMKELRGAEAKAYEKLLPSFKSESTPINPYRVAYEINEFLTDNTVYI